ncbi:hypothetical protein OH77DRAFT_429574 [Trametes cingulata]|nr:hypothetical protein OH77DRAFT_429574 [Trametes cingulata]
MQAAKSAAGYSAVLLTKVDLVPPARLDPVRLGYLRIQRSFPYLYHTDCLSSNLADEGSVRVLAAELVNKVAPHSQNTETSAKSVLAQVYDAALDWIASWFALPSTPHWPPNAAEELAEIATDEDVKRLVEGATAWDEELKIRLDARDARCVGIHRITPCLIAKAAFYSSEQASMEYARRHTSIPIPRTHHPHLSWLLMDYIDGEMLRECWAKQSSFMQFRIACTLRLYLRQLHSLRGPSVGTVDTGKVGGIYFQEEQYGPFESVRRFRQFCNWVSFEGWYMRAHAVQRAGKEPPPLPEPNFDWTPRFIHGDLNASNILLDRQGVLWLLDWDAAGFYPACVEPLAMRFVDDDLHSGVMPKSWSRYRSFIAGATTSKETWYWGDVMTAIHRFRGFGG